MKEETQLLIRMFRRDELRMVELKMLDPRFKRHRLAEIHRDLRRKGGNEYRKMMISLARAFNGIGWLPPLRNSHN